MFRIWHSVNLKRRCRVLERAKVCGRKCALLRASYYRRDRWHCVASTRLRVPTDNGQYLSLADDIVRKIDIRPSSGPKPYCFRKVSLEAFHVYLELIRSNTT